MIHLFNAAAAICTANAGPPPLLPGWLDYYIAQYPPSGLITQFGTFTTGILFTATSGGSCNGVRFWWGTGVGPVSVKAALWRVIDGALIASETIPNVAGGAFHQTTGSFGSHSMTVGLNYIVSTYFSGGYNTVNSLSQIQLPQSFQNKYDVIGGFMAAAGDNFPGSGPQFAGTYVEPLFA